MQADWTRAAGGDDEKGFHGKGKTGDVYTVSFEAGSWHELPSVGNISAEQQLRLAAHLR